MTKLHEVTLKSDPITDPRADAKVRAASKQRAHDIRNEIKRLAEELKLLPWDSRGYINWNLHRAARVIITNASQISEVVK